MGGIIMLFQENLLKIQNYRIGYKHHWVYLDNDLPVMIVARYDDGRDKTYRQFRLQGNEWVEGMPPSPYPLFGLQSLKNPSAFDALIIAEGEKCTSVLHQLGWPAISPALGAQNPSKTDWNACRYYKRFIILRDSDKAGISFAQKVTAEIKRIQPNSIILVVNLTPGINGGDLIDWLQSTVLRGQNWNGFDAIPPDKIESIIMALVNEIEELKVTCEECPDVAFKSTEALFEGDPRPLQQQLSPVPPFPLEIFPEKVEKYISIIASQFSQVPDYAVTAFMTAVGGLIGRSVHLRMREGDSWEEVANFWSILVGAPSAKKSPILRRVFSLFKPLEKRAGENLSSALKAYKTRKKVAENAKDDFDELPPSRRRYVTDDVTTPKLRELMAGNPRGIILRNDELKGQLERLDKPGNEGDRSFMMSCWSGLEDYSEDRMCRESLLNIPLALTWIGCIPPSPLQRYLCEAMGRSGGADGFMQRFQFVCYPDQKTPFTLPDAPMPDSLENEIQKIIVRLDEETSNQSRRLSFNDEAQVHFDEWLVKHENDARFGAHPLYWESHLGKQAKAVAVLAIILHRLKEALSGIPSDQISIETLKGALQAQKYYLAHARRCYDSIVGGTVSDAEVILGLIRQKRLPRRFKAQDIYHQGLGGLSDSQRVRAALDLLQDYGWVASEKEGGIIGRRNEFWVVHPRMGLNE
jgi:hypothetical protein